MRSDFWPNILGFVPVTMSHDKTYERPTLAGS